MPRPAGVSSQADPYYSPSVSSAMPHHASAMLPMASQPPSHWPSEAHSTSCSINTNPLSSFSAGTISSPLQGIARFPVVNEMHAPNACIYNSTNDMGRMETSSLSSADFCGFSGANMLQNCSVNMLTSSNDGMRETDSSELLRMHIESPSCNSVIDQRELRQHHQMSSSSMSAGASSGATAFAAPSDAFEGSEFSCADSSMLNEAGPSNGTNPNGHGFIPSQYSGIDTEQLSDSYAFDFFSG